MTGKTSDFFPASNTCFGFQTFYPQLIQKAERVYIFKGGPGTGKSTFMKKLSDYFTQQGLACEQFWCSSDPSSLDALLVPDPGIAFLDGTPPHAIEPQYPGVREELINLSAFWDRSLLQARSKQIISIIKAIKEEYTEAYAYLARGEEARTTWAVTNRSRLEEHRLVEKQTQLIMAFLDGITGTNAEERRLFGTAVTACGPRNFFDELTANYKERLILTGPPGAGKSSFLNRLARAVKARGIESILLHCGFNPHQLDGILLPGAYKACFDGAWPHEIVPKASDKVVDFTQGLKLRTGKPAADFRAFFSRGIERLAEAARLHKEVERFYTPAMDFTGIDRLQAEIIDQLEQEVLCGQKGQ